MLEQVWQTLCLATMTAVTYAMSRVTRRSIHEIGDPQVPVLLARRTRDPLKAEAAMRAHIEEPAEWLVRALDCGNESTVQDREAAG